MIIHWIMMGGAVAIVALAIHLWDVFCRRPVAPPKWTNLSGEEFRGTVMDVPEYEYHKDRVDPKEWS